MKVFKNPNRGKNQHILNQEPYTPEYERLKKIPVVVPSSREEFRRAAPKFSAPPPQVKVYSGQNIDGGWMATAPISNQQNRNPPVVIGRTNPMVETAPVVSTRSYSNDYYDEPLASAAISDFSSANVENIRDNEVELPTEEYQDGAGDLKDLTGKIDFTSLMVGEYVLIYDNDILAAGDLDDVTDLVENILTSDEYNVNPEKLAVLKKMSFRTGVLIGD